MHISMQFSFLSMLILDDVAKNLIIGLLISQGFAIILVVIGQLSEYTHIVALKSYYTNFKVVKTFMHIVVKLHGISKSIVFDKNRVFTGHFSQRLIKFSCTTLVMRSSYHP